MEIEHRNFLNLQMQILKNSTLVGCDILTPNLLGGLLGKSFAKGQM